MHTDMREAEGSATAVSVVIPAWRASHDIALTLTSVFNQTWTDFEVIVVNDGSPDSAELCRALQPFPAVRYIEQPHRGPGAARNAGIRAAKGRYVAFLEPGDLWMRDFLRRQVSCLDLNPLCDLVYCDAVLSGPSRLAGRRFMDVAPSTGAVTLKSLLAQQCTIALSTVVVRRHRLFSVGVFDDTFRAPEELAFVLRLAYCGITMRYQRVVLAERRTSGSGSFGDRIDEIERTLTVLERFGRAHILPLDARTALRARAMVLVDRLEIEQAKCRVVEGNFAAAKYHLAAPRVRGIRLRTALIAVRVAPKLARWLYIALDRAGSAPTMAGMRTVAN